MAVPRREVKVGDKHDLHPPESAFKTLYGNLPSYDIYIEALSEVTVCEKCHQDTEYNDAKQAIFFELVTTCFSNQPCRQPDDNVCCGSSDKKCTEGPESYLPESIWRISKVTLVK